MGRALARDRHRGSRYHGGPHSSAWARQVCVCVAGGSRGTGRGAASRTHRRSSRCRVRNIGRRVGGAPQACAGCVDERSARGCEPRRVLWNVWRNACSVRGAGGDDHALGRSRSGACRACRRLLRSIACPVLLHAHGPWEAHHRRAALPPSLRDCGVWDHPCRIRHGCPHGHRAATTELAFHGGPGCLRGAGAAAHSRRGHSRRRAQQAARHGSGDHEQRSARRGHGTDRTSRPPCVGLAGFPCLPPS